MKGLTSFPSFIPFLLLLLVASLPCSCSQKQLWHSSQIRNPPNLTHNPIPNLVFPSNPNPNPNPNLVLSNPNPNPNPNPDPDPDPDPDPNPDLNPNSNRNPSRYLKFQSLNYTTAKAIPPHGEFRVSDGCSKTIRVSEEGNKISVPDWRNKTRTSSINWSKWKARVSPWLRSKVLLVENESARVVGLMVWLLLLFYLLGTTASDYFTCILERLSETLNLSPPVAGVTLLAIGNGAPDVFSSFVAFVSADSADSIGFGSVLGGALFITTAVSGAVAIVTAKFRIGGRNRARDRDRDRDRARACAMAMAMAQANNVIIVGAAVPPPAARIRLVKDAMAWHGSAIDGTANDDGIADGVVVPRLNRHLCIGEEPADDEDDDVQIDPYCFIRDSAFLIVSVAILAVILVDGKVQFWEAILFLSVYPLYIMAVCFTEYIEHQKRRDSPSSLLQPFLIKDTDEEALAPPDTFNISPSPPPPPPGYPHLHLHSDEMEAEVEAEIGRCIPWTCAKVNIKLCLHLFYKYCIEWPCAIPRKLTIPIIEEDRWSRPLAIASCTLAPVFIAAVWAFSNGLPLTTSAWVALGISLALGLALGLLSFFSTENARPPQRFVGVWLAGSFFVSIIWFYLVANELVATLESLGAVFNIDSSILGLTVLAWGNSIGDFVANLVLACNGRNGVQIAIAGCYAGPLFNIVVGLGLSLVVVSWRSSPDPFLVTGNDDDVFYMIGFFTVGLIWGLIIMSLRGMRLSRVYGFGLILLYCCFLIVGLAYTMGWIP